MKPLLRVIAGRPVSERERVEFENRWADRLALALFALLVLVGLWAVATLLFALERVTP